MAEVSGSPPDTFVATVLYLPAGELEIITIQLPAEVDLAGGLQFTF